MMKRLLFFLLIIPLTSSSQTISDYDIYSNLIDKNFLEWKINTDSVTSIIVVNTLTKFSINSELTEIIDDMINNNDKSIYNFLRFYDKPVDILNNNEFKILLNDFKSKLTKKTELSADGFKCKVPVKMVKKERIERIFSKKILNNSDRAWKRFNKEYLTNLGYYEFSNIAYSENFAIVYVVHRANPLNGKGELEFFKKENGNWNRMANYGIWFN